MFLFALDQTVVGVALPKIVSDLHGSNELYTWSVTIYLLTSTVSGPIYGKLSDLFGRRPIVIFAVSLFLISSALAGLSQNMEMFILFRGLQGLGGGAVFPIALAVVADLYTPAERGKYLGLFGAVFGVSSLVGPGLGGFITDTFSWNWIFYINIPIGLISLFILWRLLPAIRRPEAGQNIDYLGAAVFTLAIVPFLIGLTNKQTGQWTDPAVGGLIVLGLVFGAVFLWVESRAKEPIVPLNLFRIRTFSISVAAMFLAAFGFFTLVIFLPRWFQTVGGNSATESGYSLLPLLAGLIFSAIASGQIVARVGRYKFLMAGSLALLARRAVPLHEPPCRHRSADDVAVDGPRRTRDRAVVRGLHADRPERGLARSDRRRDLEPDVLPADRRDGRADAGGDDPRGQDHDRAAGPAGRWPAFPSSSSRVLAANRGGAARHLRHGRSRRADLATVIRRRVSGLIPAIVKAIHETFSIAIASTFWIGIAGGAARRGPRPVPARGPDADHDGGRRDGSRGLGAGDNRRNWNDEAGAIGPGFSACAVKVKAPRRLSARSPSCTCRPRTTSRSRSW